MTIKQGTKLARLFNNTNNVVSTSYGPQFCITHKCIGEKDQETLKTGIPEVYSKRKSLIVNIKQGTKTYARTLEGASCSVKTVSKWYHSQILWPWLWSGGMILLFRAQGHRINGGILTFHYLQKGWTWLHIPTPITWTKAVHWNQIHFGDIRTHAKPYWSIGLRNTEPVIVHRVFKRAAM